MTSLYDHVRTCARAGCENVFEYDSAHPQKKYCSVWCRAKADRDKRSQGYRPEELELDVDQLDDIDALLAERGLRREDWVIMRVTVNKWEGFYKNDVNEAEIVPLRQLKVYLRAKVDINLVQPVQPLPPAPTAFKPKAAVTRKTKLYFLYGDDQHPGVDRDFEALKLEWLRDNQPDVVVDLGDGLDMPTISTHKVDPAKAWTIQECADSYGTWLYAARNAVPDAEYVILADNHATGRLRDYQMLHALPLYGAKPADIPGLEKDLEPLWSLKRLLRLDELGITYIDPPGDTHYAESQYEIVPDELVAIHGYRTGQNLGKKFIDDYGCSVIYGHQHGQDVYVTDTKRRGVGRRKRLFALGVGCGGVIQGGGGFAPGADWQNCALTVSVFANGTWNFDYVNYADGKLTWRDQQYSI